MCDTESVVTRKRLGQSLCCQVLAHFLNIDLFDSDARSYALSQPWWRSEAVGEEEQSIMYEQALNSFKRSQSEQRRENFLCQRGNQGGFTEKLFKLSLEE